MNSPDTKNQKSRKKMAAPKPVCFVDRSQSGDVQSALDKLCSILSTADIQADWCSQPQDAPPASILLLHDPVVAEHIPQGCQVLGQRTLNRRERLVLAEQCGLSVPRWSSLDGRDEISGLMDSWNVDHLLYKADWSYSRKGVRVVTRDQLPELDRFNSDADIFMHIIGGNYRTYKVDMFFDQVIACRELLTRSILFDKNFHRSFRDVSRLGEIPPIETEMKSLGATVMNYGVGLFGIDVMFDSNAKPWVIELNTSSIGREATWRHWPDVYVNGYAAAIKNWVLAGCVAEYCMGISPLASTLSARAGGGEAEADA